MDRAEHYAGNLINAVKFCLILAVAAFGLTGALKSGWDMNNAAVITGPVLLSAVNIIICTLGIIISTITKNFRTIIYLLLWLGLNGWL